VSAAELPVDGPAAPPRSNGELVFATPWESRLFGMTMALIERGAFAWSDFQPELVAAIRAWEAKASAGDEYRYYERWQEALERVVARTAICSRDDLDSRAEAFAARPHGHDHDHHHHDHDH
jgi:nitrile hydratase accessory protein